jgi:hypothetical protein
MTCLCRHKCGGGIAPTHLHPVPRKVWLLIPGPRRLYPSENPVLIVREFVWSSGPVWTGKEYVLPTRI